MPKKQNAITAEPVVVEGQPSEVEMLRGFRNLVGERWGYLLARKAHASDLSEKTDKERKDASAIGKKVGEALEALVKTPTDINASAYTEQVSVLKTARETLKNAREATGLPAKIKDLNSGITYMDKIAIPDSLKELGSPVTPRFTLSDYVKSAVDALKKKKKD